MRIDIANQHETNEYPRTQEHGSRRPISNVATTSCESNDNSNLSNLNCLEAFFLSSGRFIANRIIDLIAAFNQFCPLPELPFFCLARQKIVVFLGKPHRPRNPNQTQIMSIKQLIVAIVIASGGLILFGMFMSAYQTIDYRQTVGTIESSYVMELPVFS